MADHYRALAQSLMALGFLFRRQGRGRHEVWRNRATEQEVMFNRLEVAASPTAAAAVLREAQASREPGKAGAAARSAAQPADRKVTASKSGARAAKAGKPSAAKPSAKAKTARPAKAKTKAKTGKKAR